MKPYSQITPNVAQGAFPQIKTEDLFKICDVLVLAAEEHQAPRLKAPQGKMIIRLGFDDNSYQPVPVEAGKIFHAHAKQLGAAALSGRKILITCHMGLNRSGLMTALTLMHGYGMKPSDAIKLIRARRHKDCLCNPMFEQWLLNQVRR